MPRSSRASDLLHETVDEIRSYAEEQKLVIFYGWAHDEKGGAVYWNEEHGGDWRKFLECAKALGARAVYLNWAPFEEFQVDDALPDVADEAAENQLSESDAREAGEYRREVEKYRERIGLTTIVDLAFAENGTLHICEIVADWFRAFEELTAEEEEESEETAPAAEEPADKAIVHKWASALAKHPKFGACKSDDQREYLLEALAGEEYETLPQGAILRRADTIYIFEVRPKQEEELRMHARELRKQGLNMNAIALKLGISRDRVSGLLAD